MNRRVLIAFILGAILANLLVFGVLTTNLGTPPRAPRSPARATYTPNPELAKRMVTSTATPSPTFTPLPTPTRSGISDARVDPRNPHGPVP